MKLFKQLTQIILIWSIICVDFHILTVVMNIKKDVCKMSNLKDKKTMYTAPPFKEQTQAWPGISSKMDPIPDHGESTYVGNGKLKGRKALITGGDSGIGRAVAIAYAREGADVAISYHPDEESDAREVKTIIEDSGQKCVLLAGDIRNPQWCNLLVELAASKLEGIDILVNNAARQKSVSKLTDLTDEDFEWTVKTNVYAPFWITKNVLNYMKSGSTIINTASVVAFDPSPDLKDYAMTKAALLNFTKSLAKEVIDQGIRVNAVAPGPVWTPLQISGGQTKADYQQFGASSLFKRPGQPAELAHIYVYLASNDSSFVTAETYGITGGKILF